MKKLLALLLVLVISFSLVACGGNDEKLSGNNDDSPASGQQQEQNIPNPGTNEPDNGGSEDTPGKVAAFNRRTALGIRKKELLNQCVQKRMRTTTDTCPNPICRRLLLLMMKLKNLGRICPNYRTPAANV